jgi:hypothetical protein
MYLCTLSKALAALRGSPITILAPELRSRFCAAPQPGSRPDPAGSGTVAPPNTQNVFEIGI